MSIYLDTHVVLWLHAGLITKLTKAGSRALEQSDLLISPMVSLELELLFEIGRSAIPASVVLNDLHTQIGLSICDLAFERVVLKAAELKWTRDPFDRLIVAQAMCRNLQLLTKDATLRKHSRLAFW